MTSREEISGWFDRGVAEGKTHMVVVCDTFDWDDYPVYANDEQSARFIFSNPGSMQKAMEVYNLKGDKTEQLNRRCAFNF